MKIGELAKRARINIQTVRFYEREHLLREPIRTASGYRLYNDHDLETVDFIKRCQNLGFTLKEIRHLIDLHNVLSTAPRRKRMKSNEAQKFLHLSEERLHAIQEKINMLQQMKMQLSALVTEFESSRLLVCPAGPQKNSIPQNRKPS